MIAIIALAGMVLSLDLIGDIRSRMPLGGAEQQNYMLIQYFDDDVLDYALLTEEQRQAGLYLVRLDDGSVQLRCRNGAWIDTFDADATVSEVRHAADIEMTKYWIGTSECLGNAGE